MHRLNIIWTTDNKDTSKNLVLMYANNAILKNWWDEINLIICGASTKLIAYDNEIRELLEIAISNGVEAKVCQACAEIYNVVHLLEKIEMDVLYIGQEMTKILKSNDRVITF